MPSDTLHRFLPWAISLGVTERWIFNFDGVKVDLPGWYTGPAPFSLDSYQSGLTLFGRTTTEAILTSRTGGFASGASGFASSGGGSGGSAGGGAGWGGGGGVCAPRIRATKAPPPLRPPPPPRLRPATWGPPRACN